jgi:HAD superfamily hydrolase (TIGR01509 family)
VTRPGTESLATLAARGIRALIFDMDGVLADTAPYHMEAWRRLCAELGHPISDAIVRETFGQTNDVIVPKLLGAGADVGVYGDRKEALYREVSRGRLQPYRHVDRALRAAKARGFRLAVGTSGPLANVQFLAQELAIADCFDRIVDRSQFEHGKPAPDVFLEAARQLSAAPRDCAVFEDSVHGLRAARAAGMLVIGVVGTHDERTLAQYADVIVSDFLDLC